MVPITDVDLPALWMTHMRAGRFEQAWQVSDRLRALQPGGADPELPRHLQRIWDGRPLEGRVLVRCYHGLGDTIQFARYLPLLRAQARAVMLWVQPALMSLMAQIPGVDQVLPLHDGTPDVEFDADVELMELPYAFRTAIDTIPGTVPYLSAPPFPVRRAARVNDPGHLAVGLVWRAGDWAPHRSIPLATLAPVTALPVSWHVLQGRAGLDECPSDFGFVCGTDSVDEAASVIRSLDVLITIDSMPAHLAGALGTPVWTLLPDNADWRWMTDRADSPWYPSMRLFRRRTGDGWEAVVDEVRRELVRVIAVRGSQTE
jgi:hypothetical protein